MRFNLVGLQQRRFLMSTTTTPVSIFRMSEPRLQPRAVDQDVLDPGRRKLEVQEKLRLLEQQIQAARVPADLQRALDRLTDLHARSSLDKLQLGACLSSLNSKFKLVLSESAR
mgnify:CR=1